MKMTIMKLRSYKIRLDRWFLFGLALLFTPSVLELFAMDQVRVESRIDQAIATYGVTGRGVIVATLDRGIDWKNNDFRNANGTTRIKYIFDLSDNSGAHAANNPYGRGTIYTEAQINAALQGGPALATRDAVGHGTHTAGIPAGNGHNVAKYRGVAPDAVLIVCKVTSEGAPAHDTQPAEAPFNDATAYPVAMDFVKAKAAELGMPCVMILNLGSTIGPTDGTSELCRKIDTTVGAGVHGLVFVTGPGDDGGAPNRAGGVVAKGGSATISIQKTQAAPLFFDLWYPAGSGSDNLSVTLHTPSGSFGPYATPSSENAFDHQTGSGKFDYYHQGANVDFYNASNNKREIFIVFKEGTGNYSVVLSGANLSGDRRFDATLNPSEFSQLPSPNAFTSFNLPGNIWDGATAHNNICPGDYVHRTNWTDIDNQPRSNTGQGNIGEIWKGSSTGPTIDGLRGIDLCAPGDSLFTVSNPTSYDATFRFNKINDGLGFYDRQNAVSAAAPIVTGVIALILQENPTLDAPAVKQILQLSAHADSFTGTVPNNTWGYGKLDANAALARAQTTLPQSTLANISTRLLVQTGGNVLIGGFVITGAGNKLLLLRALGPTLGSFGVANPLANPVLELHNATGALIATNDDWAQASNAQSIPTNLRPPNSLEPAILTSLPAGSYTAIVRGVNNTTGVALVEAYDLDGSTSARLSNISTRGLVQTGGNVMIGGFIIQGPASKKVIIRALGPTLASFGIANALANPTMELRDANGNLITSNDNWKTQQIEVSATGYAPPNDLESAIVRTLAPGNYTAIVRGVNNTSGVALIEVYGLN